MNASTDTFLNALKMCTCLCARCACHHVMNLKLRLENEYCANLAEQLIFYMSRLQDAVNVSDSFLCEATGVNVEIKIGCSFDDGITAGTFEYKNVYGTITLETFKI